MECGWSCVDPAGVGGRSDVLAAEGGRQGVALPARGPGSLSAVVLAALHMCGAELTAPPACLPPRH